MRTKKVYCPVNGWDCPYYKDGECGIENPIEECDDFQTFWDKDDDYCDEEERTVFEHDKINDSSTIEDITASVEKEIENFQRKVDREVRERNKEYENLYVSD